MPFPLTPFDSSLSIASTNAPPRKDHQAMPFLIMVPHRSPINTSRWLQSRRHPILTEVFQKFLKQCLFLWLPSIQSLPKHPILTEVPSDLRDHNGPTSEPNKYKSTRTISSTSFRNLSKQYLSLWLPSIPVFPKASYTDRNCF